MLTFYIVPETGWVWESHSMSKFTFLSKNIDCVSIEKRGILAFCQITRSFGSSQLFHALVFCSEAKDRLKPVEVVYWKN